jgi:hypothetical protein
MSNLLVQNIKHTNGTTAQTIDSSGRVSLPSVPAFRVSLISNQSITATGDHDVEWDEGTTSESDNSFTQGGFSWSSGVVTVPLTGVYFFSVILRVDSVGSGYIVGKLMKNDESSGNREAYIIDGSPASDYANLTGSTVFKCNSNDNIRMSIASSADSSYNVTNASTFSGHFIG